MKARLKKCAAMMLAVAMAMIPAFSSFAAEDTETFDPSMFQGEMMQGEMMPGMEFGEWNTGMGNPGWAAGMASPSDAMQGFIPGWGTFDWQDQNDPFKDAGTVEEEIQQPYPPFIFEPVPEDDLTPEDGFVTGTYAAEDDIAAENDIAAYDAEEDIVTDETEDSDEIVVTGDDNVEYYAKLLLYAIDNMAPSDELLSGFIDSIFYGETVDPVYFDYWRSRLNSYEEDLYDGLKEFAEEIAAGDEDYPVFFAQDFAPEMRLGRAQLGISDEASNTEWYEAALNYYLKNVINVNMVMNYVYRDNPYGFYWAERSFVVSFSAHIEDDQCVIGLSAIYIPAGDGFEGDYAGSLGKYYVYSVINDEMTGVKAAAEKALEIAEAHSWESDEEKPDSFREEIARLAAFNDDAGTEISEEDDLWRLVNVFDDDPSTTADTEGYAAAYRLLCYLGGLDEDK